MSGSRALTYSTDIIKSKSAVAMIGVVFFMLATTLGAYVRIPVPGSPVPITLQTFFVLMCGAVVGRRLALVSMLGYLALGGVAIAGPTGGYLVGFAASAFLVGMLIERRVSPLVSFVAGTIVIYACGFAWLTLIYHLGAVPAFSAGILPFIPGDVLKVIAAVTLYSRISARTKEIFNS